MFRYFCRFLESSLVERFMYPSYAFVCFIIAMKMEEPKDLLPCTLDLSANYPQFLSSPEELYDLERDVLDGYILACYLI